MINIIKKLSVLFIILFVFLTSGCFDKSSVSDLVIKSENFTMSHNGYKRSGSIYFTEEYNKNKNPFIIIALHGAGSNGESFKWKGFEKYNLKYNFILVCPDAIDHVWQIETGKNKKIDDVEFVLALADQLCRLYSVDPKNVFYTGHSVGAFMTYHLALKNPKKVYAIAPVSGLMYRYSFVKKLLQKINILRHKISLLHIHSIDDKTVPYSGYVSLPYCSVEKSADFFVRFNKIKSKPAVITITDNGVSKYKKLKWFDNKSSTEVSLVTFNSHTHRWPDEATGMICSFFQSKVNITNQ